MNATAVVLSDGRLYVRKSEMSEQELRGGLQVRQGDVGWTVQKALTWIIATTTSAVVLSTAIAGAIAQGKLNEVKGHVDQMELRLQTIFALKAETMPRGEYELRHRALVEEDERITKRVERLEAILEREERNGRK